jgi:hypothetical protein
MLIWVDGIFHFVLHFPDIINSRYRAGTQVSKKSALHLIGFKEFIALPELA